MSNPVDVTFESTLAHLATDNTRVSATTLGQAVAQIFHENPTLPGIIIAENTQLIGMISRQIFREQTSMMHRKNLYFDHPIKVLLDVIRIPPLYLPETCSIFDAVQQAFCRPKSLIYEPIVICSASQQYRLLDVQVLLLAQHQLLAHAKQVIRHQKKQQQHYRQLIEQEKHKHQQTEEYFKSKQYFIQQQFDQDAERQQAEFVKQTQSIIQLNQKLIRLGQTISVKTDKVFHEILIGTRSIHQGSQNLLEVRQVIDKQLEVIHSTATMMGEIINKVRHLAVQAAVVSYQTSTSGTELSQVHFEMNRLVAQTTTVKDKLHQSTCQIQRLLQEFNHVANDDIQKTRLMFSQIEQAKQVLVQLEKLVNQSLLEQQHLNDHPHATHLIRSIERVLKQQDHQPTPL